RLDRSRYTPAPAATPTWVSPEAVLVLTAPAATLPTLVSPLAVWTLTEAAAWPMVTSPLAVCTVMSPSASRSWTSPEAVLTLTVAPARSSQTSPEAVLTSSGPATEAAVTSPEAVVASSSPRLPMADTSADAVCAAHEDPAGAVTVTSSPALPRSWLRMFLGSMISRRPPLKVTLTSDRSRSPLRPVPPSRTVVSSAGSAETATLPDATSIRMSMGSDPGNSQLVISVSFAQWGTRGRGTQPRAKPV